ncbi:MAG: hypothetical protein KGJ63_10830 [Pseudomonadota bacterium]|nr:hypothetical protein [Pseudomonadota bacterium]
MSTDRISSSSALIETMRAMARDRAAGTQRGGKTPAVGPSPDKTAAPASAHPIGELRRRLRELAAGVDVDDTQSVLDARAPALREILLWEFGSDFRQDAQFLPMVDAISTALDSAPHLQQRFVELLAELRKA